ncbi:MAG TPA: DUF4175 family protein, partial [Longimicrobiaceae bacterium]|nr:DUF4175 family protein [Longimicrobiaceae bacterium]
MDTSGHAQLVRIVGQVRRRWRLRLALKGAAVVIAAGLAVVLLAALALEQIGREPAALVSLRLLILLALVGLIARYLALPLLRRVSDERVALYLEEHEPSLQAALVSALEAGSQAGPVQAEISPALLQRTIEAAIERCREIDEGRRVEQRNLTRFTLLVAGVAAASVAVILLSPAVVKDSASTLFYLRQPEAAAAPTPALSIEVLPGDTTVARGAIQAISAQLHGFGSGQVEILTRAEGDTVFARMPMLASADSNRFELVLFDLDRPTEYFVEAEGVRSRLFRLSVADLPYVRRLELEYHFPAYTGLPLQRIEEGGDLAALEGTVARLRISPTMPVAGGSLVLEGGRSIPLQPDSTGALTGALRIERAGLYHVELQAHDGTAVKGSPQYTIDVLRDEPPSVVFTQPGRDTRVTPIEEVFVEARAEDDYGISDLQLVYSVNGGPEQTIRLFQAGRPLTELSAGHTFYLEELSLQPGDFVSYYARTTDNNGVGGRKSATSDIYFLQIRPFGRNYRQAEERGGPPGGGGAGQGEDGGGIDGALSQRQREIIAATFNLVRDRERYSQKEYQEHLVTVALAQERLREQVQTLAERMVNRRITQDSSFQKIAELLPKAAEEMVVAAANLRERKPGEALPPEQRALQQLQRAEAVYRDVQVTMGQPQGGQSGGGGSSRNAEDLADLFGLELDKLRNQYETVQRGQQQAAQQQV